MTPEELTALAAKATPGPWERFWAKVNVTSQSGCWNWTGAKVPQGYGQFWFGGRVMRAHRLTLEVAKGPPHSKEAVAMHLCDNPSCVNPVHLTWGTRAENNADMIEKGRLRGITSENKGKTHCLRGHELSGDNLISKNGWRLCRECGRDNSRESMRRSRAKARAALNGSN